jgi:hypothetical protein
MLMPEAPMNHYDLAALRKHDIRPTRKPPIMQTIPITSMMQQSADQEFRFSVGPADSRQVPPSRC